MKGRKILGIVGGAVAVGAVVLAWLSVRLGWEIPEAISLGAYVLGTAAFLWAVWTKGNPKGNSRPIHC
jgi:uncharacterized membrane protein YjjB (DUF3815 family)